MDRLQHGAARAGKITGSVAKTIMTGGHAAWETLSKKLWADDGSEFAQSVGGARGYGIRHEKTGLGLFWERHPVMEITDPKYIPAQYSKALGDIAQYMGVSPDGVATYGVKSRRFRYGIEVKSPTSQTRFDEYKYHCDLLRCPPEHVDQVQHGLLCTGYHGWYFVTHFKQQYVETLVISDPVWQERYVERVKAFVAMYIDGKKPKFDRLAANRIADL